MSQKRISGKSFYLLLILGVTLSIASSVWLVGDRANETVTSFQLEHRKLKAVLTANNLSQYVENRIQVVSNLAQLPIVTSSMMGVDVSVANLSDFMSSYRVLGKEESLYFVDILGDVIYRNTERRVELPAWTRQILNGELDQGISIIGEGDNSFIIIGIAVKYSGSTEGIILMMMSQSINELLNHFSFDARDTVILKGITGVFSSGSDNDLSHVLTEHSISSAGLVMDYLGSTIVAEQERREYANSIGLAIGGSLLLSFLILAVFIQSLLVNPFNRLARTEEKVREHKERFELAISGSNDGIWDWDIKNNVTHFSPRFSKMLNESVDELNGCSTLLESIEPFLSDEDKRQFSAKLEQHLKANVSFDMSFKVKGSNKDNRHCRIKGIALKDSDGTPLRMAGSLTDITALKTQQRDLENALYAANEANVAKSTFLANMSHEIRTPMNGILGSLQILKRTSKDAESEKFITSATVSCESLLAIINDILDFSKIESGKLTLDKVPSDIGQLIKQVRVELLSLAESKNLVLEIIVDPKVEVQRLIDPVRVKQILINLVGNAIKFTKSGEVKVSLKGNETAINLIVADTGIGMNDEFVANMFGRFEQADISVTRKFGGTGLGLAITKQLVELMGGSIKVESKPGMGSTFNVRLPCEIAEATKAKAIGNEQVETPELGEYTILLAEDNPINRSIFLAMVKSTNVKVVVANDGLEAIGQYRKHNPDLVFMDIQMPVMDGITSYLELVKEKRQVPIIALTANVMKEDVEKYQELGFNGYIPKPIDINLLYNNLIKFLT